MLDKNGFSLPLHPYQILTWVIFAFHTIFPVLTIIPLLNFQKRVGFIVLFYLSNLFVLFFGYKSTKSNPTITQSKDPLYLDTSENINFYCTICNSYVTRTSKHCGSCDRCVDQFDHHCKWLNNCIGGVNYKLFIILLVSVYTNELVLLSFEAKVFFLISFNDPVFGLILFDFIMNAVISLLLTYLISVHIMLRAKGMTTYEYIKAERKKREKKINPGAEDQQKVESKNLNADVEVKKSIIKGENHSQFENPVSFSILKASSEAVAHLTM